MLKLETMNGKIKVWATKEEEEVRKSSQQRKTKRKAAGKDGNDVKRRGEGGISKWRWKIKGLRRKGGLKRGFEKGVERNKDRFGGSSEKWARGERKEKKIGG